MDPEKTELLERRLRESVRVSVEAELKRRYSWIGLIAVLITSSVIVALFNSVLLDTRASLMAAKQLEDYFAEKFSDAEHKIDTARKSIEKRDLEFAEMIVTSTAQIKLMGALTESTVAKVKSLESRASQLSQSLSEASMAQLRISEELRQNMGMLARVVERLAMQTEDPDLRMQLLEVEKSLEETKESVRQQQ